MGTYFLSIIIFNLFATDNACFSTLIHSIACKGVYSFPLLGFGMTILSGRFGVCDLEICLVGVTIGANIAFEIWLGTAPDDAILL